LPNVDIGRLVTEFVVIVIGVLVALGIDELRATARDRGLERQYVARLIEDLRTDSSTFEATLRTNEVKLEGLQAVLTTLRAPAAVREDPSVALPDLALTYRRPSPQTTTFQELLSTGTMSLIRSQAVRFRIGDHYRGVSGDFERLDERRTQLAWATNEIFPERRRSATTNHEFFSAPHVSERLGRLLSVEYQGLVQQEREYSRDVGRITGFMLDETLSLLADLRAYSGQIGR
jgi:hypothetical protein